MLAEQKAGGYSTKYRFTSKEVDEETGLYYFGARYYDPRISFWHEVDPMAEKHPDYNPFAYTVNNPIRFIDPDGKDTLSMNRGGLNLDLSDALTNVWNVNFTIIKNGVEKSINLPDGAPEIFMFGNMESDKGFNYLLEEIYTLSWNSMANNSKMKNTIQVENSNVFFHAGNDYTNFGGCKGLAKSYEKNGVDYGNGKAFFAKAPTMNVFLEIKKLYDNQEGLSGAKFILRTTCETKDDQCR